MHSGFLLFLCSRVRADACVSKLGRGLLSLIQKVFIASLLCIYHFSLFGEETGRGSRSSWAGAPLASLSCSAPRRQPQPPDEISWRGRGAHRGACSVSPLRQDKINEHLTFLRTEIIVSAPELLIKTGSMHTLKHLAVLFSIF